MRMTRLLLFVLANGMTLTAFAQVKIGTSPTTIETTSNLEVEASTTGRQMKVNKSTGQVTISDGTQGAGRVFTSDAAGGGRWDNVVNSMFDAISNTTTAIPGGNVATKINVNNMIFDRGGNYVPSTSTYTVPTDGIYFISASILSNPIATNNQIWLLLLKNGSSVRTLDLDNQVIPPSSAILNGTTSKFFNAADIITIAAQANSAVTVGSATFQVTRLSN